MQWKIGIIEKSFSAIPAAAAQPFFSAAHATPRKFGNM
jgi:hypothetical protein